MAYHYESNRYQLEVMARSLGDLLPKVTFVDRCTTALFVDDSALSGVRQTDDVDVIVDITTSVRENSTFDTGCFVGGLPYRVRY